MVIPRVAVLLPVLNRPQRVKPLIDSIAKAATVIPCDPIFLCSPDDFAELDAVNEAGARMRVVGWKAEHGDYPRKINEGFKRYRDSYLFFLLGADDLVFHPGWVERAVAKWQETGACVIGTNDLVNRRVISGAHSTHPFVHRDYGDCGTADEPKSGKLLHEGYGHWFVDDEFVQTAMWRLTFESALDSRVEHLHPNYGGADRDATYEKGQATSVADRALYESRKRLWGKR